MPKGRKKSPNFPDTAESGFEISSGGRGAKKKKKVKQQQSSGIPELIPPQPNNLKAETLIAQNPFDDQPVPSSSAGRQQLPYPGQLPPQLHTPPPVGGGGPIPSSLQQQQPPSLGPPNMLPMMQGDPQMPMMSMQHSGQPRPMSGPPCTTSGPMTGPTTGKIYPANQPVIFNTSNPNAPPIHPCGICRKEVHENDQAILCESGCNFWFHRICTGLTEPAYQMLMAEVYAEWVCDKCLATKNIPLVKMKS